MRWTTRTGASTRLRLVSLMRNLPPARFLHPMVLVLCGSWLSGGCFLLDEPNQYGPEHAPTIQPPDAATRIGQGGSPSPDPGSPPPLPSTDGPAPSAPVGDPSCDGGSCRANLPRGLSQMRQRVPRRFEPRQLRHLLSTVFRPHGGASDLRWGQVRCPLSARDHPVPGELHPTRPRVRRPVPGGDPRLRGKLRTRRQRQFVWVFLHALPPAPEQPGQLRRDDLRLQV